MKDLKQYINESMYVDSLKGFDKNSESIIKRRNTIKDAFSRLATYIGSTAFESPVEYNDIDLHLAQYGNAWCVDMYLDADKKDMNDLVKQLSNDSTILKYCSKIWYEPNSMQLKMAKHNGAEFIPNCLIKMEIK